jgi:hypothetical protein
LKQGQKRDHAQRDQEQGQNLAQQRVGQDSIPVYAALRCFLSTLGHLIAQK